MRIYHDFDYIEVKSLAEEAGFYTISGMATTNTPDRTEDIVEPSACHFAAVIPLLWAHDAKKPIGEARLGRPTAKGIPFTAKIPVITKPGKLKDLVDLAIDSIQHGLIRCVSIGFRVLSGGSERLPSGGKRYTNIEVMELSVCSIPAQAEAVIESIRSGKSDRSSGMKLITGGKGAVRLIKPKREAVKLIKARRPVKLKRAPGSAIQLICVSEPQPKGRDPIQLIRATNRG